MKHQQTLRRGARYLPDGRRGGVFSAPATGAPATGAGALADEPRPDTASVAVGGRSTTPGTTAGSGAQPRSAALALPWLAPLPARAAPFLAEYVAFALGLVADLGGEDNLTTAQRALVASTAEVRALRQKAGRNLLARGLVQRKGDLRGAAKLYVSLVNSERLGLLALGLERRARQVDSYVADVLARERAEKVPKPEVRAEPSACNGNTAEREGEGLA